MNEAKKETPAPDAIVSEIARLASASTEQLVERYREIFGREPRSQKRDDLWKRISWRLQEIATGGMSGVAKRRLAELQAEIKFPGVDAQTIGSKRAGSKQQSLLPGMVLVRDWRGVRYECRVEDDGFVLGDKRFKSLSAVARHITGQAWSGALFFGLKSRSKRCDEK